MASVDDLQAQIDLMKAQMASQGGYRSDAQGRSPVNGPYTNLLEPKPSAHTPKANFFFEGMDLPKVPYVYKPFPCIRYRVTETGIEERTIKNQSQLDALGPEWQIGEPNVEPPSRLEEVEDALASLTPEERAAVVAESHVERKAAIRSKLATLSPADLAGVADASAVPKKRGRPRKID